MPGHDPSSVASLPLYSVHSAGDAPQAVQVFAPEKIAPERPAAVPAWVARNVRPELPRVATKELTR